MNLPKIIKYRGQNPIVHVIALAIFLCTSLSTDLSGQLSLLSLGDQVKYKKGLKTAEKKGTPLFVIMYDRSSSVPKVNDFVDAESIIQSAGLTSIV